MKICKIIKQISEDDYNGLSEQFRANKSEKFLHLFSALRSGKNEDEIFLELEISDSAFYTLKSRLTDKIQEYLYLNIKDERVDLLKNISNIDNLLFKFPKETAIGLLLKMEKDLLVNDMPSELTLVYNALKKLHINTPKYYDYTQKYNKSVAYNLGLDKAESVLLEFNKVLRSYYVNNNDQDLNYLILYKKEITHLVTLYPSHHLIVFKKIIDVQFALYVNLNSEIKEDDTIEDSLKQMMDIFNSHPNDKVYLYYKQYLNFLYFEYYSRLSLFKNAQSYLTKILESNDCPVYCNRYFFSSVFFMSVFELYASSGNSEKLHLEIKEYAFDVDEDIVVDNLFYYMFYAFVYLSSDQINLAIQSLNTLLNNYNLKSYIQAEIESKLLLAFLYIAYEKIELSEGILRSVSKKVADNSLVYGDDYLIFIKLMRLAASNKKDTDKLLKAEELYAKLDFTKNKSYSFLKNLNLDNYRMCIIKN